MYIYVYTLMDIYIFIHIYEYMWDINLKDNIIYIHFENFFMEVQIYAVKHTSKNCVVYGIIRSEHTLCHQLRNGVFRAR